MEGRLLEPFVFLLGGQLHCCCSCKDAPDKGTIYQIFSLPYAQVSREDGRWYANMHHLRHFKALHLAEAEARLQSIESLSTSESSSGLFEITALSVGRIGGSDLQPFDDGVHGAWRELSKWVRLHGFLLPFGHSFRLILRYINYCTYLSLQ